MTRVISYIDGFNLYFGLRAQGWRKYYWLDLVTLSTALLKQGQQLDHCHYFTARIRTNGHNAADMRRQTLYLEALSTLPGLSIYYGHYLEKQQHCRNCGATWPYYEEKMTDVNIATQLLCDAFEDRFDMALIVSADSDLTTPVAQVRVHFPHKRAIIALPPKRRSHELTRAANGYFIINETTFRRSQLPATVTKPDGFVLQRPDHWK
mgnify:CR=1 FL=1